MYSLNTIKQNIFILLTTDANLNRFTVNDKGILVKKTLFQRIVSCFYVDVSKKAAVNNVVNYFNKKAKEGLFSDSEIQKVQTVFFQHFAVLSAKEFDRACILEDLQDRLSPELAHYRKETDNTAEIQNKNLLSLRVEQAKLALKLGVVCQKNKGIQESIIYKSCEGKFLGIFKAISCKRSFLNYIKVSISRLFLQRKYLSCVNGAETIIEVIVFKFDQIFKFGLVPETAICKIDGKKGSFQIFVYNYKEAAQIDKLKSTETEYSSEELNNFQLMAIFDYLIGNVDRHGENWLVSSNNEDELSKVVCIDNGNAFPIEQPQARAFGTHHLYEWREFGISGEGFTPETKKFINENITQDNLARFEIMLKEKYPLFVAEREYWDMIANLEARFQIIRNAAEGQYKSPSDLPVGRQELVKDQLSNNFILA